SARRSAKGEAAASQTVVWPSNARCRSMSEIRSPGSRLTVPSDGSSSPAITRKSVVFPDPFRPTTPQRSPLPTVKVTSRRIGAPPRWTATEPKAIRLIRRVSPLVPRPPLVLGQPDRQPVPGADQGDTEEERLLGELFEPAIVRVVRVPEPELGEALRLPGDQRVDAELLRQSPQLAGRGRAPGQIDEVRPDPSLREEAERLPRVGAFPDAEDLHVHVLSLLPAKHRSPVRRRVRGAGPRSAPAAAGPYPRPWGRSRTPRARPGPTRWIPRSLRRCRPLSGSCRTGVRRRSPAPGGRR